MKSRRWRWLTTPLILGALCGTLEGRGDSDAPRRMSFHNRLLLNRAIASGLKSIEVLALAKHDSAGFHASTQEIADVVERLGGRVLRMERDIGYVRLTIPTERLLTLAASTAIQAYQIATLSRAAWYHDGPPLISAEMFRGFEVTPIAATEPSNRYAELRPLSIEASREPGYTAENDVGLREWMAAHPTFDGRGVTIALVENAVPSFTDPTLRTAKSLDGRDIPKVAGILNTMEPDSDETRVVLDTPLRAATTWTRVGSRTYILPRAGRYRFGRLALSAGSNVVHQFGVLEHEHTREVWIDANGDASFQDESPLADVNERFEPRLLKLAHPRKANVSFVMGRGQEPHVVHIFVSRGSHQTMTLSVAAGSKADDSLAYGVAPNARVLLVRAHGTSEYGLTGILEGFLAAAQRPDVDVISASAGITIVPNTGLDFLGQFFRRLIDAYGKPTFNSAGNTHLQLATAKSLGGGLSVGGSLGVETFAALYGGRRLDSLLVHLAGAAGPGLDGSIKPDFLAPMERVAADLPWKRDLEAAPQQGPTRRLPPGYQISCCTSATSPYAAGVAALLISAARQTKIDYSVDDLVRAMTFSARFLPGFASHEQGNGVLDINAAWQELTHVAGPPPRIVSSARVTHPLTRYAAGGSHGVGIFEVEGWEAGTTGRREIQLQRASGADAPVTYRVTWTGNDGTFKTVPEVRLPLGKSVALPITIAPTASGAHSALLELREPASERIAFRTQATIVAAARVDPTGGSFRTAGRVRLMRTNTHFVQIPEGTRAVTFELEVIRGVVKPTILPASGLFPAYAHVHPSSIRSLTVGKHVVTVPDPEPGMWTVLLSNRSTWLRFPDDPPADDGDADYRLTFRVSGAAMQATGLNMQSHQTVIR